MKIHMILYKIKLRKNAINEKPTKVIKPNIIDEVIIKVVTNEFI